MAIYSEFSHKKWWFSIVMLNYQRVMIMGFIGDLKSMEELEWLWMIMDFVWWFLDYTQLRREPNFDANGDCFLENGDHKLWDL